MAGGDALTVDKLGKNMVLVVLGSRDMEDYRLDFEALSLNDEHSRKILIRIMQAACYKSGIAVSGKSVKLEAIRLEDGCYILITVDNIHRSHTYKIKNPRECRCYSLGNSGNFLNAIEMLYRQNVCCNKNSVYVYNNEYYIIFEYPAIPRRFRRVLSEYAEKRGGRTFAARVMENGRRLCKVNAIAQIGKHLV